MILEKERRRRPYVCLNREHVIVTLCFVFAGSYLLPFSLLTEADEHFLSTSYLHFSMRQNVYSVFLFLFFVTYAHVDRGHAISTLCFVFAG